MMEDDDVIIIGERRVGDDDVVIVEERHLDPLEQWVRRVNRPLPEITLEFMLKVMGHPEYRLFMIKNLLALDDLDEKLNRVEIILLNYISKRNLQNFFCTEEDKRATRQLAKNFLIMAIRLSLDILAIQEYLYILLVATFPKKRGKLAKAMLEYEEDLNTFKENFGKWMVFATVLETDVFGSIAGITFEPEKAVDKKKEARLKRKRPWTDD
ncbi:hypothetical protein V3C99_017501 [Haemonchus contortus]|uniref:Uncharacterized protein n=1 Tax=Haemonchus contortus TaxID=6289 RepID=A0A7I4Z5B8_HAECO